MDPSQAEHASLENGTDAYAADQVTPQDQDMLSPSDVVSPLVDPIDTADAQNQYLQQPADYQAQQPFSPGIDSDRPPSRYNSPRTQSRPGSGLSGAGDRHGYGYQQDQGQRQQQQSPNKNSVVIKVGMVGDAQIGKTSLMVKYVEGSWDEDYIQTLGMTGLSCGKHAENKLIM